MPIKFEETEINGHKYKLNLLPTEPGLDVLAWLGDTILGPIGASLQAGGLSLDKELSMELIGPALAASMSKLNDRRTAQNVRVLFSGLVKDGKAVDFSTEFAGDYGTLSQLAVWAVKINFASFFVGNPLFAMLQSVAVAGQPRK